MAKAAKDRTVLTAAPDHRAVRAWAAFGGDPDRYARIEVLKETSKSRVYRLVGLDGRTLIAKRCRSGTAALEAVVYTHLLPRLDLTALRYHGQAPDPDPGHAWLFLEDAGEVGWDARTATLLSEWIGRLHTTAAGFTDVSLPERGPAHYLRHLRAGCDGMTTNMANTALTDVHRRILEQAVLVQELIGRKWDRIATLCAAMPSTVVHGDLAAKNVRIMTSTTHPYVVVLDWETVGCGPLAPDLPKVNDVDAYLRMVRAAWPHVDHATLSTWVSTGNLLRLLASVDWASASLPYHTDKSVHQIRMYVEQLRECATRLRLEP